MDLRQFPRHISSAFENADQRLSQSPLYDGLSCKIVLRKKDIFTIWHWLQNVFSEHGTYIWDIWGRRLF